MTFNVSVRSNISESLFQLQTWVLVPRLQSGVHPAFQAFSQKLDHCWTYCPRVGAPLPLASRCSQRSRWEGAWPLLQWYSQDMHESPASSCEPVCAEPLHPWPCTVPSAEPFLPWEQPPSIANIMSCSHWKQKIKSLHTMSVSSLSSPETSVYYFKKTELISLKQGRQAPPPFSGWSMWFHVTGWRLSLGNGSSWVFSHIDVFVKVIHAVCLSDKYPNKYRYLSNYL